MHSGHIHADNLFHRLFSYSPRPLRSPLEDFCTEALAWCLLQQSTLQNELVDEIRSRLDERGELKPLLKAYDGKLEIFTQLSYRGVAPEAETTATTSGRFDLVMRSVPNTKFVIVIESKVGADSDLNDQVKDYKSALQKHPEWQTVSERYVVSLTPASHGPLNADAHLSWTKVHGLLSKAVERENEPASHRTTYKQFADFLDSRGLNLVTLMHLTIDQIQSFAESARFFHEAKKFFECFAENESLKSLFRTQRSRAPVVDTDQGVGWYGIYSSDGEWSYAGFYFLGGKMGLFLEVVAQGNLLNNAKCFSSEAQTAIKHAELLFNTPPTYDGGRKGFKFAKPLTESDETDDMIKWFAICAADAKQHSPS